MRTLADLIMFKSKWIGFTVFLLAQHLGAPGVGLQKAANQPAEMSEGKSLIIQVQDSFILSSKIVRNNRPTIECHNTNKATSFKYFIINMLRMTKRWHLKC